MKVRLSALLVLSALLALSGCGGSAEPREQWVVRISSDAPIPQLGDRLLVEVLDERRELACSECRRLFGLSSDADLPLSFGLVQAASAVFVRARLFRSVVVGADGFPAGEALIDVLGRLPAAQKPAHIDLVLPVSCFGVLPSGDSSCDDGKLRKVHPLEEASPLVSGSSDLFADVPCGGEPPDDMVCVPGGAFLLGSAIATGTLALATPLPEHLVRLSPFALDRDEVTVGQVRKLLRTGEIASAPTLHSRLAQYQEACTYTETASDDHVDPPVNCISRSLGEDICRALHKRLPSEAEWEYAAGNRGEETEYPWGDDRDACQHAQVGRGRDPMEGGIGESASCRSSGNAEVVAWGAQAGGAPKDVTELGIKNLAGNLSELVADAFAAYSEPCWSGVVLRDPVCSEKTTDPAAYGAAFSLRGGSWSNPPEMARAATRNVLNEKENASPYIGLRCALSLPAR